MRIASLHLIPVLALLAIPPYVSAQAPAAGTIAQPDGNSHDLIVRSGVWRGTLGMHQVMVYLDRCNTGEDSQYYYLNHRFGIVLNKQDPEGTTWTEVSGKSDSANAQWQLAPPVGNHLSGEWISADGQRRLPISLTRAFVPKDGGNACSGPNQLPMQQAYDAPRVAAQKLKVSKLADGLRRVSVLDDHVKTVELPDDAAHAATFNSAQRAWLTDNIAGYYDCALQTSAPPEFNQSRAIVLRAGTWVGVEESYSASCGGPYPAGGVSGYQTWDLVTGKIVEPWTWIKDSKVQCDYATDCGFAAPKGLNAIILAEATRNKDGDDCAAAVNTNNAYQLRPAAKGLVFSTSFAHVIQACDEAIEIPYAQLQPFLTKAGNDATAAIQRAVQSKTNNTK